MNPHETNGTSPREHEATAQRNCPSAVASQRSIGTQRSNRMRRLSAPRLRASVVKESCSVRPQLRPLLVLLVVLIVGQHMAVAQPPQGEWRDRARTFLVLRIAEALKLNDQEALKVSAVI